MTQWQPTELLREIAGFGYFQDPAQNRDALATFLEHQCNISVARASDLLTSARLVAVRYDADPANHSRDQLDHWTLELTEAGLAITQGEP